MPSEEVTSLPGVQLIHVHANLFASKQQATVVQ